MDWVNCWIVPVLSHLPIVCDVFIMPRNAYLRQITITIYLNKRTLPACTWYDEWWCTVEIGIYQEEASPPADYFEVHYGLWLRQSRIFVPNLLDIVSKQWDHNTQSTAAGPFQWLIMGMMNDDALLRLESNKWKHLQQQILRCIMAGTK